MSMQIQKSRLKTLAAHFGTPKVVSNTQWNTARNQKTASALIDKQIFEGTELHGFIDWFYRQALTQQNPIL